MRRHGWNLLRRATRGHHLAPVAFLSSSRLVKVKGSWPLSGTYRQTRLVCESYRSQVHLSRPCIPLYTVQTSYRGIQCHLSLDFPPSKPYVPCLLHLLTLSCYTSHYNDGNCRCLVAGRAAPRTRSRKCCGSGREGISFLSV